MSKDTELIFQEASPNRHLALQGFSQGIQKFETKYNTVITGKYAVNIFLPLSSPINKFFFYNDYPTIENVHMHILEVMKPYLNEQEYLNLSITNIKHFVLNDWRNIINLKMSFSFSVGDRFSYFPSEDYSIFFEDKFTENFKVNQ